MEFPQVKSLFKIHTGDKYICNIRHLFAATCVVLAQVLKIGKSPSRSIGNPLVAALKPY